MTLSEVLNEMCDDILNILKENGPLTQDQIYSKRNIEFRAYNAYAYALDKLERQKKIIYTDHSDEDGCIFIDLQNSKP